MKSIITFFAASIISFSAFSQSFVYSTSLHISDTLKSSSLKEYNINFTTPQAEAITYKWELITNTLNAGWTYSLCDYGNCHISIPRQGTMNSITLPEAQNGLEGFFKLAVDVSSIPGDGLIVLYVFDSQDQTRGDTVSFYVNYSAPISTEELLEEKQYLSFYPNPAKDEINIEISSSTAEFILVTNMMGQTVLKKELGENSNQKLDVSSLKSGIYCLSLSSKSGILETKQFVIN